ncbi:unnamed protein product [Brachionus calyciflorus]|uniref:Ferric-chelate reductase 1 n=1 Tax=Brachionus calyciflorus TaxID=104777 RepID=A0A813PWY6_9BILA|nr:unnamed protein product [Brachionus calyciflorus]
MNVRIVLFLAINLSLIYALDIYETNDCNTRYGCFFNPKGCVGKSCDFIAKWIKKDDHLQFIIGAKFEKLKSNWVAVAFSHDATMGDDSVVACKYKSDKEISVESYFNDGKMPVLLNENNPSEGLKNSSITIDQNFLICSFERSKTVSNFKNFFDLNQNYYLLMAKGKLDKEGSLNPHGKNKIESHSIIDFNKAEEVKSIAVSTDLVKIHAVLMVLAWSFMSTLGVLFARYYKYIFPGVKLGGVQFWFTIHRSFMAGVCLLTLVAFGFIFAFKNWKWTDPSSRVNFMHSIFGIVTITLCLVQPIMAFFRPDKGEQNRPIFNWAHRSVGIIAYISSTVAVFLGVLIFVENYHWVLLLSWIVWLLLLIVVLEVINSRIVANDRVQHADSAGMNIEKNKMEKSNAKSYFLVMHLIVSAAWTISLILAILELF